MNPTAEIEHIVEQAVTIARTFQHEYVTTEHLLLSMVRYAPFRKTLDNFGVEIDMLDQDLTSYLAGLQNLVRENSDLTPKKNHGPGAYF